MRPDIAALYHTNDSPSVEQRHMLLCAIAEPERDLRKIKTKIAELSTRLRSLLEKEKRLKRHLAPFRVLLSPFRRLPDDIIREIFLACLPSEHNPIIDSRDVPLVLTRISRGTREVALSTPRLWAAIHIPLHPETSPGSASDCWMERKGNQAKEWLRRSRDCDLTISVYEEAKGYPASSPLVPQAGVQHVFEEIAGSAPRWKNISLTCSFASFSCIISMLPDQCSLLRLSTFSLTITSEIQGHNEDPHVVFNSSPLADAPRLRDLRLHGWSFDHLYRGYAPHWNQLIHLSLGNGHEPVRMLCAGQILQLAPQLRTCRLYLMRDDDAIPVSLQHLTSLSLALDDDWEDWWDTPPVLALFEAMAFPALERLMYNAYNGFGPLLGLVHAAGARLTHFSVRHLYSPLQLIECLRYCPHLRELEVWNLCREEHGLPVVEGKLEAWARCVGSCASFGGCLLRALAPRESLGDGHAVPEELCPKLEYLSFQDEHATIGYDDIATFVRKKCAAPYLNAHGTRHSRLKGLFLTVLGDANNHEVMTRAQTQFAKEIEAGLRLSVRYEKPYKESAVTPPDAANGMARSSE